MSKQANNNNVIGKDRVRIVAQPAMLDCGTVAADTPAQPMAVVPLLDGETIAGFEVRCSCGASVVVECLYETGPSQPIDEESGS